MVVRLKDAVLSAVEAAEPLHLPGTCMCPQKWCWEDGHQRLQHLCGHADVEVCSKGASCYSLSRHLESQPTFACAWR